MTFNLRILATSDIHMQLLGHDYATDKPLPHGLLGLAGLIEEMRADARASDPPRQVLLVDNGDLLQGTPLDIQVAEHIDAGQPHPVADMMNRLGYDAVGLGNHDFDFGLESLARFASDLEAPVLCANLRLAADAAWLRGSRLIDLPDGPRVGIMSALPQRTQQWAWPVLNGRAEVAPMVRSLAETGTRLRSEGADIVIALAHTGLTEDGRPTSENALARIAADGCADALIGGHTHRVFPGPDHATHPGSEHTSGTLHGCPCVMPGSAAQWLGVIDLDLSRAPGRAWQVDRSQARVLPCPAMPRDTGQSPGPGDAIRPVHARAVTLLNEVVGHSDLPLTSYFAQAAPTAALSLLAGAQAMAIDTARRGTRWQDLPLLSAVAPPKAGGRGGPGHFTDIPPGPLRRRHLSDLHVYANKIWAVQVSGADIHNWLERAASGFSHLTGAESEALLQPEHPCFDFDVIHGLTYAIDPTHPPRYDHDGNLRNSGASRISELRFEGERVREGDQFLVAVNSHRACGGGQFPGLSADRAVMRQNIRIEDALRDFVAGTRSVDGAAGWSFAPAAAGVPAVLATGPGAVRHLDDIAHLSPGAPQLGDDGFVHIPLTL